MKTFIITIDTEGDNLWEWRDKNPITTRNVAFLQRFQDLADEYNYKPTWLSNWEMLCDDSFVKFAKKNAANCEIGMHLHAWNNPPLYELCENNRHCNPYLIEYPESIMEEKIRIITEKFEERLGFRPVSHRAGRWAINETYFRILAKYGYKYDCSITPGIDWSGSRGMTRGVEGPNYKRERNGISIREGITEIPLNTVKMHYFNIDRNVSRKRCVKKTLRGLLGQQVFLRPGIFNINVLVHLIEQLKNSKDAYLMFMIHSSELMPGGSPYCSTVDSVECLYRDIKTIFELVKNDYIGMTLEEFGMILDKESM